MQLIGIHHVTAITSSSQKITDFFTKVLGMRLIKKNVNQDDLTSYHLYFGDDYGNPGTTITFFDFKDLTTHVKGADEIERITFLVPNDESLKYWKKRFFHYNIPFEEKQIFDMKMLYFEDFDKQRYALVSNECNDGERVGQAWKLGPVPQEYAITSLGPIFISVSQIQQMKEILIEILNMNCIQENEEYMLFEIGSGVCGSQLILKRSQELIQSQQGYGSVHHIAFRVYNELDLYRWEQRLNQYMINHSGYVDRFYFKSLYARIYPQLLFEISTDGPGFIDDEETYDTLGEQLTLPSHLRKHRAYIEKHLEPIINQTEFKKEYF